MSSHREHVIGMLPGLANTALLGSYSAWMPFSMDGKCLEGEVRPGLWVCGAHGPRGMKECMGSAKLMRDQILARL